MKRALTILAVAGLLGLFASAAMAATTDTGVVTITVKDVEALEVDVDAIPLSLTQSVGNVGASNYDETVATIGNVKYSHNYVGLRSVKATAVHDTANSSNDITLKLKLADPYNGGQISDTLVNGGTDDATGAVWRIVRGAYVAPLIWTVNGTLATTPRGIYKWTVTATTQEDPGAPPGP